MLLQWFKEKPVWVVGAGVAATWVGLDVTQSVLAGIGDWLPLGLGLAGTGLWLARKGRSPKGSKTAAPKPVELGRSQVETLLKITQERLDGLRAEGAEGTRVALWQDRLTQVETLVEQRAESKGRSLVVLGGRSTGKSALIQALIQVLPQEMSGLAVEWSELPALFDGRGAGDESNGKSDEKSDENLILASALAADGAMMVLAGDLTATELEILQRLGQVRSVAGLPEMPCVPLVVVNKRDQWLPEEEAAVMDRIRQRLTGVIPRARIVSTAADPNEIKVRKHQTDGSVIETMEQPEPAIADATQALKQWVETESVQWQWGSSMRQLQGILQGVQTELSEVRRSRSMVAIEQSQWMAAAAAFANPVPGLDLVATAAVNGQLVMDLGQVYKLSFELERASAIAKTFGELMVKQGLVELSSQAIGSTLKTNAMTYVAGGAIQAMSAAYLTRVAGLALVALMEEHSERVAIAGDTDEKWLSPERIGTVLQATFTQVRDGFGWTEFIQQGAQRLGLTAVQGASA